MQSNVILYLPIKINVLWLDCIHMPPNPKAEQLLWLEKRKQASYRQCTIQGQSGSPQESHLISSSLHVINLPAQCYCSAGHSSSFRDRGIDQVRTVSVAHLCVLWANKQRIKSLFNYAFVFSSINYFYMYVCLMNECIFKQQKTATEQMEHYAYGFSHLPASWLVSTSVSCGLPQVVIFFTYHQHILSQTFLLSGSHQENRHQGQAEHC